MRTTHNINASYRRPDPVTGERRLVDVDLEIEIKIDPLRLCLGKLDKLTRSGKTTLANGAIVLRVIKETERF